jgi:uncharacterized protein
MNFFNSRGFMILFIILLFQFAALVGIEPNLTIEIPMRDGYLLPADLYYSQEKDPGQLPCILLRSPAGRKNPYAARYAALSQHGYVVVIQDTRSAADREGKTFPGLSDGWGSRQDGYDTVEWLAQSRYSNGKIGTTGVSALGITQYLLAPTSPPSLKCQYIGVAASSMFHHALCPGGQFLKDQVEGWLGLYAKDSGVHSYAFSHPFYNEFWDQFNTIAKAPQVTVPAIHYGGWYDTFLQGTLDAFVSRQENGGSGARGQQKLVIGPWTHFWPERTTLGDFEIPNGGLQPPFDMSCVSWFDYHLKGIANSVEKMPPVTYYVMGPFDGSHSSGNVWRQAERWPPESIPTPFYLCPNAELCEKQALVAHDSFRYTYHPYDPVPTLGGRNLFIESGPKDQQVIEKRKDVLVFTTSPLKEEIEVTGQMNARLYFSSDSIDTDVVVRLTDVYPDGRSILIADGLCRTGRKTLEMPHNPEVPIEIDVDLSATSIVFAKGHSIRISISSSNYPRYERNLNVGYMGTHKGSYAIAENKVHVGKQYPSRIILPVVSRR